MGECGLPYPHSQATPNNQPGGRRWHDLFLDHIHLCPLTHVPARPFPRSQPPVPSHSHLCPLSHTVPARPFPRSQTPVPSHSHLCLHGATQNVILASCRCLCARVCGLAEKAFANHQRIDGAATCSGCTHACRANEEKKEEETRTSNTPGITTPC